MPLRGLPESVDEIVVVEDVGHGYASYRAAERSVPEPLCVVVEVEPVGREADLVGQDCLHLDLLVLLLHPRHELGLLCDRVAVDLVSAPHEDVDRLGVVLLEEIVPERVGSVEGFGVYPCRESVAAVSDPTHILVEARHDKGDLSPSVETVPNRHVVLGEGDLELEPPEGVASCQRVVVEDLLGR